MSHAGSRPPHTWGSLAPPSSGNRDSLSVVGASRFVTVVLAATLLSAATTSAVVACKHGDYDGSYDGSFDGGASIDGSTSTHVVQPDKTEIVASSDGVLDVTFGPGTFTQPATITITSAGEQTLDIGLVVPIFIVSADKEPARFFQVSFHGSGNANGGLSDRALVPAFSTGGTFTPLAIAGTPANFSGPNQTYWGLTKTFGTYSLGAVTGTQMGGFADNATSCTAQCCHGTNGAPVAGYGGGCFCPAGPDLACFLASCSDVAAAGARCSAIAASNTIGSVTCAPFGSTNCPGPGCPGSFSGTCGTGGVGGSGSTPQTCCIVNKNSGTCTTSTCPGFSARCNASTICPVGTKCCVFESESYCATDCPEAQRACSTSMDCADAGAGADGGADGGVTCQGGACPVAVCGTPPSLCK